MAKECGFTSVQHTLPEETPQEELAALAQTLDKDETVHGILVQLPLPKHLNSDPVVQSIRPEKEEVARLIRTVRGIVLSGFPLPLREIFTADDLPDPAKG